MRNPKIQYACNPHLPPILRFDYTWKADGLPELLEIARTRALTNEEAQLLVDALLVHEPSPSIFLDTRNSSP